MSSSSETADRMPREEAPAYPMPEDPPEFGDDGLGFLNTRGREPADPNCLDDGLLPAGAQGSDDDVLVKKDRYADGTLAEDDYKAFDSAREQTGWEDPFTVEKSRSDQQRAERVARQRETSSWHGRLINTIIPYGGVLSTAFNLASSTIGAGIIAMPAAFNVSGILMSVVYLVVVALLTVYSFLLLTIVAEKTGIYNWERMARRVVGPGVDYLVVFVMWFLCFGGDVSYTISLMTVLASFLDRSDSVPAYLQTNSGHRLITAIVWLGVILPMCLPKEINSLRYFSAIAIVLVAFFVICMVVHGGQALHKNGVRDDLVIMQTGNAAVQGLSIYLFGYIAQVNVFHTLEEAHKPSVRYMFWAALLGVGVCFILYFLSGFFGYMEFGTDIKDTVLPLYNPLKEPVFAVSYVGLMLKLCVGFALHLIPCRDAVYYVAGTHVSRVPWWVNALVSTAQATAALLAGLFIPKVTTVFGLLGGFCGSFIGFIFPSLFMMYSGNFSVRGVGWFHFCATYVLLVVGVIGLVWGTGAAIYGEVMNNM